MVSVRVETRSLGLGYNSTSFPQYADFVVSIQDRLFLAVCFYCYFQFITLLSGLAQQILHPWPYKRIPLFVRISAVLTAREPFCFFSHDDLLDFLLPLWYTVYIIDMAAASTAISLIWVVRSFTYSVRLLFFDRVLFIVVFDNLYYHFEDCFELFICHLFHNLLLSDTCRLIQLCAHLRLLQLYYTAYLRICQELLSKTYTN